MAVLPNDIGRLRSVNENHRLTEDGQIPLALIPERKLFPVVSLKRDESRRRHRQFVEVSEKFVDFLIALLYLFKVLVGNLRATLSKRQNKFTVLKAEHDVGNGTFDAFGFFKLF